MKNAVAKDLHTPKYKMRVVKCKKGKGSFKRVKRVVDFEWSSILLRTQSGL